MQYWISLGSNLGDRRLALQEAEGWLSTEIGEVTAKSSVYETAPWGMKSVTSFYNQVVVVRTAMLPEEVLKLLLQYEGSKGRVRDADTYQDRIIDLDILYVDNMVIETNSLTVPHPKIQDRRFILEPLCEISENGVHPVLKSTHRELLKTYPDSLSVNKIS